MRITIKTRMHNIRYAVAYVMLSSNASNTVLQVGE